MKLKKAKKNKLSPQCEGWRRIGGLFSFGPVTWIQCEERSIVMLKVKDESGIKNLPACHTCWNECIENKLKILGVKPLQPSTEQKD